MKWNYQDILPVEGSYKHRMYDKNALRSYIEEHFPFDDIRLAFDSVGWNLEVLVLRNDLDLGDAFYTSLLVDWKDCLHDYWIDIANGHICTTDIEGQKWRRTSTPIHESEFLRRCFFCETEEDIWDVFHDLPLEIENNLKECYYGYSPISAWFPVYIKDPSKAVMMQNYLYGKPTRSLGILVRLGSQMGVVNEYESTATIVGLAEDHIALQLDCPLESTMSYYVPKMERDKVKLAVIIENQYIATEYGRDMAVGMMLQLQSEEIFILEDVEKLHDMIGEYRQKKDTPYRSILINDLKQKYFPNGAEKVEFNEDLMNQIELYVKDNYYED